jgi:hypothetical protein
MYPLGLVAESLLDDGIRTNIISDARGGCSFQMKDRDYSNPFFRFDVGVEEIVNAARTFD